MKSNRTSFGLTLPQRATLFGVGSWDHMLELAREADRNDLFDSVWVGDSVMAKPRPEPIALLGALTAATKRLRLGVGCMASFALREPVLFAEQWATLDFISNGRMQLAVCTGIGLGGTSAKEGAIWGVPDSERGARMTENITICRRLWNEERVSFDGAFRSFVDASVNPKPIQRPCPIWIAANPRPTLSGRPLRRVAEVADGWMLAQVWPGLFGTLWSKLSKHLAAAGKSANTFANIAYHNINVARDRASALAETRRFLNEYYGPVFSAEQAEGWTAAGTPAECIEDLNRLIRAGAKAITLRITGWNQNEQFNRIAAEVLPYVDSQPPS
ncbi:MAG TPA: LLM class flavin-dependent oxidoreductase [Candidatus Binataceae bacterium]|nr:LLM class flavin-dependent oxidoreductase [Candidatus Binataceae bacterium]